MKIVKKDHSLKRAIDIKEEKMTIVLSWLLEFRFSTPRILGNLLEHNKNTSPFFSALLRDGFIKLLINVHTNKERLFMLTKQGVDFLEAREIDIANAMTVSSRLERYSMILHDVGVQNFIVEKKDNYFEVIWDKNIKDIDARSRPDALLKLKNGYWIGLEYERWRKSLGRIFTSYVNQAKQITQGKYGGVYFVFNTKIDHDHYVELFEYERWPLFTKDLNTGQLSHNGLFFKPSEVENLRKIFKFEIVACE